MSTTTRQFTPADETLKQLGGNKFIAMTGAKNLYTADKGLTLSMHLTKNKLKAKYLQITLDESTDTYKMVFSTIKTVNGNPEFIDLLIHERVYNDMLVDLYRKATGHVTNL